MYRTLLFLMIVGCIYAKCYIGGKSLLFDLFNIKLKCELIYTSFQQR